MPTGVLKGPALIEKVCRAPYNSKMDAKSDKQAQESDRQADRKTIRPVLAITCANCRQRVTFDLKDCPWCGASLAYGFTNDER
jgi:hypothetical protein